MKEIELKNLTKIYSPDILALKEVSLTIEQGRDRAVAGRVRF